MTRNINLWIDDERPMPEGFNNWAKSSEEAIAVLKNLSADDVLVTVAFDHDLGYNWEDGHDSLDGGVRDDNTRRVAKWMSDNDVWAEMIIIHTANPIGRKWLRDFFDSEAPIETSIINLNYKDML